MSFIIRDAEAVKSQIRRFKGDYPEAAEDMDLLHDMLEGETDLHRVINKALEARSEALSMVLAISDRESSLAARRQRHERQAELMKDLIKEIMLSAGLEKVKLTEATVSILKPKKSVNVIDVNELSQGFYTTERKPDKKAIKEAFDAGFQVPGAELVKGDFSISVRV